MIQTFPLSKKSSWFKLSVLSLALSTSFAYADETTVQELETIDITAAAVPTRVSLKQMEERTSQNLKQVLQNQIGVSIGGGNGVAQFFSIRGMGEDKINLVVDGTSQSTKIFHHQSRFMLDPALIKNVDVEKGTGSASAGFGALAGTFKVTTVDAKDLLVDDKPFGARIGSNVSSNKGANINLAAYVNTHGFDALIAGNYLKDGNYKDGHGDVSLGSKLDQRSLLAKLGYAFNENHQITLSYRQEYQEGRRTDKAEFPITESTGTNGTSQREQTINLTYLGRHIGFIDQLEANVFRIHTNDIKPAKNLRNIDANEESTTTAVGGNINLRSLLAERHILKYGINLRRESSVPSEKDWKVTECDQPQRNCRTLSQSYGGAARESKKEYGLYVEGIWDFKPIILTTGLRYDYFKFNAASHQSRSDGQLNPSLGLIWEVNDHFSLLANLNQASRSPRLNEALLANERSGVKMDLANNLKAETARRAELGFKWANHGFDVRGSVFRQDIRLCPQSKKIL